MTTLPPIADPVCAGPPQGQWTVADVLAYCPADDGNRYELIKGELYCVHAPHWDHQGAEDGILVALHIWNKQMQAGVVRSTPGILFSSEDAVIPDVVWIQADRLASVLGSDGKLHGSPDLVVEVLSSSAKDRQRDYQEKRLLYARYGVAEYWIIDRFQRQVAVYRLSKNDLHLVQMVTEHETLTSPLLPGFACLVADLFAT